MRWASTVTLLVLVACSVSRAELSADELGPFVDGVVQASMQENGIAGAIVSIVNRDSVIYEQAYGIASQTPPLDADSRATLFRIGSISKTFTYVAAMQLVEQHKLDLRADANSYLPPKLRIPDEGFGPVRVWNLMTHTAGFEDGAVPHLFRFDPARVETLDEYLARFRPHRVRAPGVHADYSNYSIGLLGAIVSHLSGEPFEDYVEAHLLAPLGMEHTTFREPLLAGDRRRAADVLIPDFAVAMRRDSGGYKDQPFEHLSQIGPAGACSSTAHDLTRWMRMLLSGGSLEGKQVLSSETFRELVTVNFRNAPDVGGIAHGFFRKRYGHHQSLEHAGDTLSFHSNMVLLPDAGVGVFVSTNTNTGSLLARALPRLLLERMLPDARPPSPAAPVADFAGKAKRFAGTYLSQRRAYTTFERLFVSPTWVAVGSRGALLVLGDGRTTRWVEEGPLTFQAVDTGDRMQFIEDGAGRVIGYADAYGHSVADRVGTLDDLRTLGVALAVLALLSVGVLFGAWGRRKRDLGPYSRTAQWGALLVSAAAIAWLAFLAVGALAAMRLRDNPIAPFSNYPSASLRMGVGLAYLGSMFAVAAFLLHLARWRRSGWTIGRRVRHTLVVVMMLFVVALLLRFNVLLAPYALGG